MKPLRKHLKLIAVFTIMLLFSIGCSKDSDDIELLPATKCFVVKEKDTNIPIVGATIGLTGYRRGDCSLSFLPCNPSGFATGNTDRNGESCINMRGIPRDIERLNLYCRKLGYKTFWGYNITSNFREIYLEPE